MFTSKGGESSAGLNKQGFLTQLVHWELLVWGGVASFFLLRFFSLVRFFCVCVGWFGVLRCVCMYVWVMDE